MHGVAEAVFTVAVTAVTAVMAAAVQSHRRLVVVVVVDPAHTLPPPPPPVTPVPAFVCLPTGRGRDGVAGRVCVRTKTTMITGAA